MTPPLAYLTGEYPRATDTFIQREVAALRALGIDIETCSIRRTGPEHMVGPEQQSEAARTFYTLSVAQNPLRLLKAHLGALIRTPGRYFSALGLAWRTAPKGARGLVYQAIYFAEAVVLAAHLRRIRARHLHNHIAEAAGSVAMLAARLADIPFSFTLHGPGIFYQPYHWRLDEKIRRAAFVACISNFARAQAMNLSGQPEWGKLKIVHCGVDPTRYQRDKGRAAGKHLLFVGRLAAVKGVPILFQAFAEVLKTHSDATLSLIGDGPERSALEAEATRLGLVGKVTFRGYQSQDAVSRALSKADIFVLPSFAEGVPVVLMEAMATGLPVVATAVGGVSELVDHQENGLLVPASDTVALTRALTRLLDNPALCADLGRAGRVKVAAAFDSRQEAAKLAALLTGKAAP